MEITVYVCDIENNSLQQTLNAITVVAFIQSNKASSKKNIDYFLQLEFFWTNNREDL